MYCIILYMQLLCNNTLLKFGHNWQDFIYHCLFLCFLECKTEQWWYWGVSTSPGHFIHRESQFLSGRSVFSSWYDTGNHHQCEDWKLFCINPKSDFSAIPVVFCREPASQHGFRGRSQSWTRTEPQICSREDGSATSWEACGDS